MRTRWTYVVAGCLLLAACSGSEVTLPGLDTAATSSATPSEPTTTPTPAPPAETSAPEEAPSPEETPTADAPDADTTPEAEAARPTDDEEVAALETESGLWELDWSQVNPTYIPDAGPASDPFFHIHTSAEQDGFYLSFEMFTIWGDAWTGQLGRPEISCLDQQSDTGICVHMDPDGPGPSGDIAADFGATGEMTIDRLDEGGYDIMVHSLRFTDGTEFAPFRMTGS